LVFRQTLVVSATLFNRTIRLLDFIPKTNNYEFREEHLVAVARTLNS
jgi:hypothetical protein